MGELNPDAIDRALFMGDESLTPFWPPELATAEEPIRLPCRSQEIVHLQGFRRGAHQPLAWVDGPV